MTDPVIPDPAATVVVLRPALGSDHAPFEVLLLRRSAAMSFMPGAHVFPGGRVDDADRLGDSSSLCDGLEEAPRFASLDAVGEFACRVAAVRELVEEAAVLLARRRDGRWASAEEAELARRRLAAGDRLESVVRDSGWRLALDALVPFGQFVTPASEPRRFDTHFFLAVLPDGQRARWGEVESDELVWLSPAPAIERATSGDMLLLPPTWVTLMQLAAFDSIASVLEWARTRSIVRVEPTLTAVGDGRLLTIPARSVLADLEGSGPSSDVGFSFEPGRGWRPAS